ncbi:uncharacterized protein LOC132259661 [Phlebotomus argentipes]|uniref:uncharacterized protein LOC132259661 n=1 Tax=Phlebotomus argentipes TaxID=94469 RepID=UPI002892D3D1|nr:uncharacterized protein LOC132259661 [Phlebotomus argentipes]
MMRRMSLRPQSRSPSRRQSIIKAPVHHSLYTNSLVFGLVTQKTRRRDSRFDVNENCDGKLRFYKTPQTVADQLKSLMNSAFEDRCNIYSDYRKYNAKRSKVLCQLLAQEIKRSAKSVGMRRSRVVTLVSVIPKLQQGVHCSMMFFQDPKKDLHASHKYETPTFFILGVVFLVYKD